MILVVAAAAPAVAAQPRTAVDQRAERFRSELQAAFRTADPEARITSGVYRPPIGPKVAFACNGEDTLAASGSYTLRATSCAEKAASGPNVGAVRGHTKVVCRGSNLALVPCEHWTDISTDCRGSWHDVQSRDFYTAWSCAFPGVELDSQMQLSLVWARFLNNVETQPHSHWSLWVVLKTQC